MTFLGTRKRYCQKLSPKIVTFGETAKAEIHQIIDIIDE